MNRCLHVDPQKIIDDADLEVAPKNSSFKDLARDVMLDLRYAASDSGWEVALTPVCVVQLWNDLCAYSSVLMSAVQPLVSVCEESMRVAYCARALNVESALGHVENACERLIRYDSVTEILIRKVNQIMEEATMEKPFGRLLQCDHCHKEGDRDVK